MRADKGLHAPLTFEHPSCVLSPTLRLRLATMPIVTPEDLASIQPDYIIVGGGTSGLSLAARYVALRALPIAVVTDGGVD